MAFQKFLNDALVLIATITFSIAHNTAYDTAVNNKLQDNVPLEYNVKLQYLLEDNILLALYSIIINITYPLENITLHSVPIKVIDAILIRDENNYTHIYTLYSSKHIRGKNILILYFNQSFAAYPAKCTLEMTYIRNIHDNRDSLLRPAYLKESNIIYQKFIKTGVEIMKARQLFPCRDDLAIKSTFQIAVKHHEKFTVLSNMPIREKYKNDSTMMWTYFEKSGLMSAQHIAVVITIFESETIIKDTNVTIWYRPSIYEYVIHAKVMMMYIIPYFMKYYSMGLSKLDIVALPHSQDDNLATFGLLLCREADIIFSENFDWFIRKREIAHFIARQLAFLWSYDVLLWSKEGFATFFGAYILDEIFKGYYMMDLMVTQAQQDSLRYDTPSTINSEVNSIVLPLNYMKSFIIWRMLYHVIPDVFWTGIRKYIDKHHNSSSMTIPDDLWITMQTIHHNKFPNRTLYLKSIINSWIRKKNYPVLKMTRHDKHFRNIITDFTAIINYIQSPYLLANDATDSWIHLTYTIVPTQLSLHYDSNDTFWLTSQNLRHIIQRAKYNEFVIVNIQQVGYYRVNYDFRTWRDLILYLNSENYSKIHILNRAQFIDDAFYFILQKQFDYYVFWNLTSFMLRDMNFVTWYPMFKVFESMSCIFSFHHADNAKIQLKNIIMPLLRKIGYHQTEFHESPLTIPLREEVVKWACVLNVSDCRDRAARLLLKAFHLPINSNLSILFEEWIWCYGFSALPKVMTNKTDDTINDLYMQMMLRFQATNDNRYLEYLTCAEEDILILRHLKLLMDEDSVNKIKLQENVRASAFLNTIEKHANRDAVLSFVFDHFANLTLSSNKRNDVIATLLVIITNVHSRLVLPQIADYVKSHYKEQIVKAVKERINKRNSEFRRRIENYGLKLMQSAK